MSHKVGDIVMLRTPLSHEIHYYCVHAAEERGHTHTYVSALGWIEADGKVRKIEQEHEKWWTGATFLPVDVRYFIEFLDLRGADLLRVIEEGKVADLGQEPLL
jgi:hypothetical protein